MALTAGIVGLPNVGKSTLFNAITKQNILAANYPFATIDPNVGVVLVKDKRLDVLADLYHPEAVIPTAFEFTDIAGLVKGASTGEGLGNKFLSHVREVDAICHVVRCFEGDVIHVENSVDPIRDIDIINLELVLSDMDIVQNRIDRIGKKAVMSKDKEALEELAILERTLEALKQGIPARKVSYTEDEFKIINGFHLLSIKPVIYVANVNEEDLIVENKYVQAIRDHVATENASVITMCAKIESELSELDDDDKMSFLQDLGIEESGLDKLIHATYSLLGLATYFTCGPKEVKAWTFRKGMKAPTCAGIIHSDFERGFIRAEVIGYQDMVTLGGEKEVKEKGKMRLEGKEYVMQDGDICHFRFNV